MKCPSINMKKTGRNLKGLCEKKGYDAPKLQKALGLGSVQACYHWFEGISIPKLEHLMVIARLLEVRVDQLIVTEIIEYEYDEEPEF